MYIRFHLSVLVQGRCAEIRQGRNGHGDRQDRRQENLHSDTIVQEEAGEDREVSAYRGAETNDDEAGEYLCTMGGRMEFHILTRDVKCPGDYGAWTSYCVQQHMESYRST